MHHFLSKPDWLEELNDDVKKRGSSRTITWDEFVLVENDWASGRAPEDVADDIVAGNHKHVKP